MRNILRGLLLVCVVLQPVSAFSITAPNNGVEIGNGKPVDNQGGFELGNSFANDVYKLKQVIGKWQVEYLKQFTEFRAQGKDAVRTKAEIDLVKEISILTLQDLMDSVEAGNWLPVHIGNAYGVKHDGVSLSGIRQLEYKLFRGPGEIVTIVLSGPLGKPMNEAFENFQKTLESLEVTKS